MPDQIIPGQQNLAVPPVDTSAPRIDPISRHKMHLARLAEKVAGANLDMTGLSKAKPLSGDPSKPLVKITVDGIVPVNASETVEVVAPVEETAGDQSVATEVVEDTAGKETAEASPSTSAETQPKQPEGRSQDIARRQRSLDIQRRADATAKRARAEAVRIAESKKAAERQALEAEELSRQVRSQQQQIQSLEREYAGKLDLLKTNPLEFARQHGVDGQSIAQFVKDGADPTQLAIKNLEQKFSAALNKINNDYDNKIKTFRAEVLADKQAEAQRNFFDYLDEAQKATPESFQAVDLVYSQKEIWEKANELAEKSDRLQLNWSSDRLLEELESSAKKEPRWQKISAKMTPTQQTTTNQVKPKPIAKDTPNTQENDKTVEEVKPGRVMRERNEMGQFQGRQMTPMEKHKAHVAKIAAGVRFTR